jgi:hypothetical protein
METADDSLLCRDEREPRVLASYDEAVSCVYRASASVCRLSLFLLLENRERPPDDCLDLSAEDMSS